MEGTNIDASTDTRWYDVNLCDEDEEADALFYDDVEIQEKLLTSRFESERQLRKDDELPF